GIIAEFNPLHKGHEELIRFAKSDGVIIILSGNFTQRGSPAIIDKFLRAELAVKAGADLVFELPFLYACSAGQDFARGAVEIFRRLGFVSRLAFGMEEPEFDFMPLVYIMLNENEDYKKFLHEELDKGASFTKANSLALDKILPGSREFLVKPNNLLALSYILEVKRHNYNMKMMKLKRSGNFRSKDIRESLHDEKILDMLPTFTRDIICSCERLCDESKLWPLLQNIFIRSKPEDLRKIYGIDEGIEGLFLRNWRNSQGLDDFIGRCVCARYTRAHIRRRLIYILLGLDRWEIWGALRREIPYVRVLAFNERGREILRRHGKNSNIRIITRLSEAKTMDEKFFAQIEYRASGLYELLMKKPDMKREAHRVLDFS
ncbi:MAG: nucleotidyltransferase family protein, partial [Synergistaceae bacterium]|nr:nucleotidyltransferase family protein [Synergistaceae bacterium]